MTRKIARLSTCTDESRPASTKTIRWIPIVLTLLWFICVKILISYVVLSGFSRVILDIELDHTDQIDAYYSTGNGFQPNLMKSSHPVPRDKRTSVSVWLNGNVTRTIRLDLGRNSGTIQCYGITFTSFFGKPFSFTPQQIFDRFIPNDDISSFTLKDDHLVITTQANDPYISYRYSDLKVDNVFISTLLPIVFSIAFYILITKSSLDNLPGITDLKIKTSSTGTNINSLDGIRGIAALAVLAEHTGVMKGIGSIGVWLFFTLSGFLLATPFVNKPERALSYDYMSNFIARRLKRILPMYYVFLTFTMVFKGKNPEMFRHFFFLQGDGHLWTLPQEMFFYLLLPFIVVALYLLFQNRILIKILFLAVLILIANTFLTLHVLSFYGYGTSLQSMTGIFLGGVMFRYVYHWLQQLPYFNQHSTDTQTKTQNRKMRNFCSRLGSGLLLFFIIFSLQIIPDMNHFTPSHEPEIFGFLSGVFILLVVLAQDTPLSRIIGCLPLRAVGIVSFSFYLLHPQIISVSRLLAQYFINHHIHGVTLFIISSILTYICALFTYSYIEKPFLQREKVQTNSYREVLT